MRLVLLALALGAAGCGSSHHSSSHAASSSGSVAAVIARRGADVALIPGNGDFAPGPIRYSFLVVRSNGRVVERPQARVWVARSQRGRPVARTTARLEAVGVPGVSDAAVGDVTRIYVARFRVRTPGRYVVVTEPIGGKPIQGVGTIVVNRHSASPAVGTRAPASRTPTLASTGGNVRALTTREPPDRPLLRYSVAQSLAEHTPFVLVFATPKFCTSRTCGPVVDVVEDVARRFAPRVRFIHVEVFRNNDPAAGYNRWMRQWHLVSEPWIFLVGADGRIKAKFEGSVSVGELTAAVRRLAAS
jgi:hypothetical protein